MNKLNISLQHEEIRKRFQNLQVTNVKEDLQERLGIKSQCHEEFLKTIEFLLGNVPEGRCKNEALTHLETALMFANKAIMND